MPYRYPDPFQELVRRQQSLEDRLRETHFIGGTVVPRPLNTGRVQYDSQGRATGVDWSQNPFTGETHRVSGPTSAPAPALTDERILRALQSDRFFYKFLCMVMLTNFRTARYAQNSRFCDALDGTGPFSIFAWKAAVLTGGGALQRSIGDFRAYFTAQRDSLSDGINPWPPVQDAIRDLVTYSREMQTVWRETFQQHIALEREHGTYRGQHSQELRMAEDHFEAGLRYRHPIESTMTQP